MTAQAIDPEHVVATNAWAFLLWLSTTRGMDLQGWDGLQRYSAADPAGFCRAVAAFARLGCAPTRLARHRGDHEALVLLHSDGVRQSFSRNDLLACSLPSDLPGDLRKTLRRSIPAAELARALAETLLQQDIRADDRILVAGNAAWPTVTALVEGATVLLYGGRQEGLRTALAEECISVVLAPASWLSADALGGAALPGKNKFALRTLILTGPPWSLGAKALFHAETRPDVLLLARDGDTVWGSPLDASRADPRPWPALFTSVCSRQSST